MKRFTTSVYIIGVNPYVFIPDEVLQQIQKDAKKEKGPIPVKGLLQGKQFRQTLVKFQGAWRLYLNTSMRVESKTQVGDTVVVDLEFDPEPPIVTIPKKFLEVLRKNKEAETAFEKLPPYRQKEINSYLGFLKTDDSLIRNIEKVINHLTGKKVDGVLFREKKSY